MGGSRVERYLAHLDRVSGGIEPRFTRVASTRPGLRGVTVISYDGVPEPGMLTAITYGVSLAEHPEWRAAQMLTRMRELGVTDVAEGVADKARALAELLERRAVEPRRVACLVDDTPDLPMMAAVGLPAAVSDAHPDVIGAARHVTRAAGGCGAVREFCDFLLASRSEA